MMVSMLLVAKAALAYDLLTLYELTNKNNNLIKSASMQVLAQNSKIGEAESEFLPHVGVEGAYGRLNDNASIVEPFPYIINLPNHFYHKSDYSTILLGLTQNIINFQAVHKIQASKLMTQAKKIDLVIVTQQATFDFLKHYFYALDNANKLEVIDLQEKDLRVDKKFALHELSKGAGVALSVYKIEVYLKNLRAERISTSNNLQNSLAELSLRAGITVNKLKNINTRQVMKLLPPHSLVYWLAQSMENNPSIKKAQLELQALNEMVDADKSEAYPTVYLRADVGRTKESIPVFQSVVTNRQSVELGVKVPLFTGNYISSESKNVSYQLAANEYKYQDALLQLKQETSAVYLDILALHAKLFADLDAVKVSRESLKATRQSMFLKMKTYDDLLESEHAAARAELTYNEDAYNAILLRAKLYQLAGQLDEKHIKVLSSYLN